MPHNPPPLLNHQRSGKITTSSSHKITFALPLHTAIPLPEDQHGVRWPPSPNHFTYPRTSLPTRKHFTYLPNTNRPAQRAGKLLPSPPHNPILSNLYIKPYCPPFPTAPPFTRPFASAHVTIRSTISSLLLWSNQRVPHQLCPPRLQGA
jgi:hypothetical protein